MCSVLSPFFNSNGTGSLSFQSPRVNGKLSRTPVSFLLSLPLFPSFWPFVDTRRCCLTLMVQTLAVRKYLPASGTSFSSYVKPDFVP